MVNNSEKLEMRGCSSITKQGKQRILTDVQTDLLNHDSKKIKIETNEITNTIQNNIFQRKKTINDIYDVYKEKVQNKK